MKNLLYQYFSPQELESMLSHWITELDFEEILDYIEEEEDFVYGTLILIIFAGLYAKGYIPRFINTDLDLVYDCKGKKIDLVKLMEDHNSMELVNSDFNTFFSDFKFDQLIPLFENKDMIALLENFINQSEYIKRP